MADMPNDEDVKTIPMINVVDIRAAEEMTARIFDQLAYLGFGVSGCILGIYLLGKRMGNLEEAFHELVVRLGK